MNGIDFWREENGQFVENWVFVDMVHLFAQMVDLMERKTYGEKQRDLCTQKQSRDQGITKRNVRF